MLTWSDVAYWLLPTCPALHVQKRHRALTTNCLYVTSWEWECVAQTHIAKWRVFVPCGYLVVDVALMFNEKPQQSLMKQSSAILSLTPACRQNLCAALHSCSLTTTFSFLSDPTRRYHSHLSSYLLLPGILSFVSLQSQTPTVSLAQTTLFYISSILPREATFHSEIREGNAHL